MTLVVLAGAWLLGMAAVGAWDAPPWMAAAWLAALIPVAVRWAGARTGLVLLSAVALALLGGLRFTAWVERPTPELATYVGDPIIAEGVIASEGDPGLTTVRYDIAVEAVLDGGARHEVGGGVRVTLGQFGEHPRGTAVRFAGTLEAPLDLDTFDYGAYLARRDIVGVMAFPEVEVLAEPEGFGIERTADRARGALQASLQRSLPEPEASLAAGIVIGRDETMPPELEDAFRETGLAHLVAVSGSNIALVTAIVFFLLTPLIGRTWAIAPAAVTIVAYVLVAGGSETVVRAGIMAAILLGGYWLGRPQSSLAALGAAAIAMTAVSPATAADVGFQLSVAATAGPIVFSPWIRAGLDRVLARLPLGRSAPGAAVDVVALSLAASIATVPIIWVTFERVSLVGILLNVPAAPLFAVTFWTSSAAAVAGALWEPAGWALGLVAYYPLRLLIWLAETGASVPLAAVTVPGGDPAAALAAYAALTAIGWPAYRYLAPLPADSARRQRAPRLPRRMALAGVASAGCAAVFLTSFAPIGGPGRLELTVLDVGQGDAILVTTPGGERVLVDGGPSGLALMRELGEVLPHWERTIDVAILTHPQADHVSGLAELLQRYDVNRVLDGGTTSATAAFTAYVEEAGERERVRRGHAFEVDGVQFDVLWPLPGEPLEGNDASLVLRVTYGDTTVLLTGDIEAAAQRDLLAIDDLSADVLKVPHHGAATSAWELWEGVSPTVAVISAGEDNRFGHPAEITLARLADTALYRTDLDGRVTILSDGERLRVRTER